MNRTFQIRNRVHPTNMLLLMRRISLYPGLQLLKRVAESSPICGAKRAYHGKGMPKEDIAFWQQLWQSGSDTFTLPEVNKNLVDYIDELLPKSRLKNPDQELRGIDSRAVLVPLCGRTSDLAYLEARQSSVWGVDLVEDALAQFAESHGGLASCSETPHLGFKLYRCHDLPRLTLVHGDFLKLTSAHFSAAGLDSDRTLSGGPFDGIWDRGGLTSMPPALRAPYARHLHDLLRPGGRLLLEILSTNVDPSLSEGAISGLLADAFLKRDASGESSGSVKLLRRADVRAAYPEFNPPGLTSLDEVVLLAVKGS